MRDSSFSVAVARNKKGNPSYSGAILPDGSNNLSSIVKTSFVLHDPKLVIDMPWGGRNTTQNGWTRNSKYYFTHLLHRYADAFSSDNKNSIKQGQAPVIDSDFVSVFPQFSPFVGDTLDHHHIGEGCQAVAVPHSFHIGHGGIHRIEAELGLNRIESEFKDFYKSYRNKHIGSAIYNPERCLRDARYKFLEERLPGEWESRLLSGNEAAMDINDPVRISQNRTYGELFGRVLSISSVYSEAEISNTVPSNNESTTPEYNNRLLRGSPTDHETEDEMRKRLIKSLFHSTEHGEQSEQPITVEQAAEDARNVAEAYFKSKNFSEESAKKIAITIHDELVRADIAPTQEELTDIIAHTAKGYGVASTEHNAISNTQESTLSEEEQSQINESEISDDRYVDYEINGNPEAAEMSDSENHDGVQSYSDVIDNSNRTMADILGVSNSNQSEEMSRSDSEDYYESEDNGESNGHGM